MLRLLLCSVLFSSPALAFTIGGTLEVKSGSLRVKREDDMKVHFYPGRYKAEIQFDRGAAHLMIERKEIRTDATLSYPGGTSIPENGEIRIDGFRSGQTFAIAGTISTVRDRTPSQRENESCTTYRQEWVCHGYYPHQWCDWEMVPVPGWRQVEFHFLATTRSLKLGLDSRNGGSSELSGRSVERSKVYTYEGPCY